MRGLKSTIALIVVLLGLGAYIYFVTWKQPEGGADAAKKQDKVFAGLDSSKIEELKVTSAAGDATTVKKDAGGWQVMQPVTAKADESEIGSLTSALASTEVSRVVDENPTNLNDYGLSNPRIEVDFKAAGDKDYRKLMVGGKTPTGGDLYARRNDEKKVFLIPAFQESTLNRTTPGKLTFKGTSGPTARRWTASTCPPAERRSRSRRTAATGSSPNRCRRRPISDRSKGSSAGCRQRR